MPFDPTTSAKGFQYIIEQGVEDVWKNPGLHPAVRALLEKCWRYNPAERPTMEEVEAELIRIYPVVAISQ
jgi:hypothetical protein